MAIRSLTLSLAVELGVSDTETGVLTRFKIYDMLAFEAKRPNFTASNDLFKLSVELQFMLNGLVYSNIDNATVFGVLARGMIINRVSYIIRID